MSPREPGRGWLSRERSLALVLLAATAVAVYLCYRLLQPFLPAVAFALALAVLAHPLHSWIRAGVRHEGLAAALAVALVAVIVVAPLSFAGHQLVRQATTGIKQLNGESGDRWRAALERNPRLTPVLRWVEEQLDATDALGRARQALGQRVPAILGGSAWAAAEVLIGFFALFYFFRDRSAALRTIRSLLPLSHDEIDALFARVNDTIHASIYGSLVVALIQGCMGGLMFWILGLPAPVVWAVVMFVLAVVPTLGTFVVWLPAAVFLALEGSWGKALVLLGWGSCAIGLIDNLLYPHLVGHRLRLHPLAVFFAILGGVGLFGVSGLILGPVVLSVTEALIDVWRTRTRGGRTVDSSIAPAA